MKETIGIFAHVDAGKTTLSEMLLFKSGTLRTAGRVDEGSACMDYHGVEKNRGITVYSAMAPFRWKDAAFYLIDTPGHKDFLEEMEQALCVLDKAIIVVSAVEGVQSGTETIWHDLERLQIPVIVFINKIDRAGADVKRVEEELKRLSPDCTVLTEESVAERDEDFLEGYLLGCFSPEEYKLAARRAVNRRHLMPVVSGSALKDEGVDRLLDLLAFLWDPAYDDAADLGGIVWQVRYDSKGVRWTIVKVTSGRLLPKMELVQPDGRRHQAGELRFLQGGKSANAGEARAGDICAVSGISDLSPGAVFGTASELKPIEREPILISRVTARPDNAEQEVFAAMKVLEAETPSLKVQRVGEQMSIHANGTMQLEVLPEILKERFHVQAAFEKPQVIYKETLAEPVMGYGHYEPLKHYSEVHLLLEPQPRGSGITFASRCPTDSFGKKWQNLVKSHVFERKHRGVLTGSELVDVKVILMAGKEHYLHTAGGDFREATYRAIRQGLMKGRSLLLEPVYQVKLTMETAVAGTVINRITGMGGNVENQHVFADQTMVTAMIPVVEMLDYVAEFASLTHGRGAVAVLKTRWLPCHNAQQVIEEKGYCAENDLEQPADSVFCRKGVARLIKYDQVEAALHIPLERERS